MSRKHNAFDSRSDVLNFIRPILRLIFLHKAAVTKIAKMGAQISYILLQVIQQIFEQNKVTLFETHSAGQLLFEGYKISFMDDLNKLLAQRGIPPSPTQFGLMYKV